MRVKQTAGRQINESRQKKKIKQLDQRIKYRTVIKENNLIKKTVLDFLQRRLEGTEYIKKFSQVIVLGIYFMNMHLTINAPFYSL